MGLGAAWGYIFAAIFLSAIFGLWKPECNTDHIAVPSLAGWYCVQGYGPINPH